jgi:hypothetical protein
MRLFNFYKKSLGPKRQKKGRECEEKPGLLKKVRKSLRKVRKSKNCPVLLRINTISYPTDESRAS